MLMREFFNTKSMFQKEILMKNYISIYHNRRCFSITGFPVL